MPVTINSLPHLLQWIKEHANSDIRIVIAISGFGGSGKSSTSNKLAELLEDASIIRVDDFIAADENGAKAGYLHDWQKLENLVFAKARKSNTLVSKIYDWDSNQQVYEEFNPKKYLIIEGSAGLFQDKYLNYFDIKIWMDVDQMVANDRGKKRDIEEFRVNHDDLWDNVWSPREREGFRKQRPDLKADILLRND